MQYQNKTIDNMATNENAKWDKMICDFIDTFKFTNANSHKEVFTKNVSRKPTALVVG